MSSAPEPSDWQRRTEAVAAAVRRRVLEHVIANNGGYLSQACSSAEILATLYTRVMRLGASEGPKIPPPFVGVPGSQSESSDLPAGGAYNGPKHPELDRFIFSPVHYALVLYATLVEVDRLAPEALEMFNRDGSTIEMIGAEHSPGIETTAGSLGQALSQAAGIAMARKLRGDSGRVWVFMSDGELQEGQTWEAFAAASYLRLTNLGVYIDANGQQCDGPMTSVMSVEPISERLRAFGATVREVDGHDVAALSRAAEATHHQPLVVVCRTDPCRGVDALRRRDQNRIHHVRFVDAYERGLYEQELTNLTNMERER